MSGALVLAAGFSRRFGSDKRQFELADGTPMLLATLSRYQQVFDEVAVVIRPEDQALTRALGQKRDLQLIYATNAMLGMGHSLAAGADALRGWRYLFVGLADMPFVLPATLRTLREAMERAPPTAIVQPLHHNRPGHPVGFGSAHFAALINLQGDNGARQIIADSADQLIRIEVDDPGVIQDLDTPP